MTSYAQSIEQRGLRVTLKLEITPDAFEHYDAQALAHARRELKDNTTLFDRDSSGLNGVALLSESLRGAISKELAATTNALAFTINNIGSQLVCEKSKARAERADSDNAQAAEKASLAEAARELSEKLLAVDAEKRDLESKLAAALEVSEIHQAANRTLAQEGVALKKQLESRTERAKRQRTKAAATKRAAKKGGTR